MLRSFLRWLEVWLGGILSVSSLAFPRMDPVPSTEKKTEISPGTDRVYLCLEMEKHSLFHRPRAASLIA